MKTLILDNYDSFTYNLAQYVAELGGNPEVFYNDKISLAEIRKRRYTHIIISPGPGAPQKKKDFGVCGEVIKKLAGKIPILGVCLGHQGIIHYFGGKIIRAPEPIHGKRSKIKIKNTHPLFKGLPKIIEGMRYHSLIADARKIPKELDIIAQTKNGFGAPDDLVMAVAHKTLPLFGAQFHPESIGTPHGKKILKNFLLYHFPKSRSVGS
ncbi:MAG: aminodeoxychorismate/anthranilate synthase component II [Patescibacteria group bacterium]